MFRKAAGVLAALLSTTAAQAAWQQGSSRHFVVYANDTPEHVRAYTERLERFDAAIRAWHQTPEDQRGPSARVTVFVLSDVDAIQKLSGMREVAGYYEARAGESVAFVPRTTGQGADYGQSAQSVLFHEYTHHWMLTNWTDAALPPWYTEGAAELHATAVIRPDGDVVFGAPPLYRGYTIDKSGLLPANQLTRLNPGKLDGINRDALYSRGWLLTDYLTFDANRRKQLAAYLVALNSGKSAEEADAALGGVNGLDLKLDGYLRKIKVSYPSQVIAKDQISVGDINVRALTPGEAAIMPVYMASKSGVSVRTAGNVVAAARAVAASYPNDPAVQNELAEAEFDACNLDKTSAAACYARAEAAADRALAADPKSIHAMLYKGFAQQAAARKAKVTDPARWAAIRRWFTAANKADTEAPQPLLANYESYRAARLKPTVNAQNGLLYAYALAPYDLRVRTMAAEVLLDQGKAKEARAAIAPVAYYLDDPSASAFGQKVLAALDKDGAAAALAVFSKADEDARKKEEAGKPS